MQYAKPHGTYLGVDQGGTKLLIGEADAAGKILFSRRYPSGYTDQHHALRHMQEAIDDYLASRDPSNGQIVSMGAGLVGRVDCESGIWFEMDQWRMHEMPLADLFARRYGIPCRIDNDVRSATRAEMRFGYGQTIDDFIYLNVGTGLAAGIVIGGRLVRGSHCNAGEIGHTHVGDSVGVQCGCGRMDCVECYASGGGIDISARALLKDYPATTLAIPRHNRVSVQEVLEKADTDPLCRVLRENAVKGIAGSITNLVQTTDPEVIVLGGGVVANGLLIPGIRQYLHTDIMRFVAGGVQLTKLDPGMIGLLGACTLAMECEQT